MIPVVMIPSVMVPGVVIPGVVIPAVMIPAVMIPCGRVVVLLLPLLLLLHITITIAIILLLSKVVSPNTITLLRDAIEDTIRLDSLILLLPPNAVGLHTMIAICYRLRRGIRRRLVL